MGSALLIWLSAPQVNVLEEISGGKFLHNYKYPLTRFSRSEGVTSGDISKILFQCRQIIIYFLTVICFLNCTFVFHNNY